MSSIDDIEADRVNLFLHAENVRLFSQRERHLPVTIVTGFLGAGKTTLLNHILTNKSNLRIAAAINDFAELNIDENLIKSKNTASRLVELSNGCICCHLLGDLQEAVWKLLENDVNVDAVNYLVVETSGVSDPLEIIRTLDNKFGKCFRARLDSVVTVVDADAMLHETMPSSHAIAQLKCADIVILNKIDLLHNHQDIRQVEERIRAINADAVIYPTRHCNVPLSAIMDVTVPCTDSGNVITHEKTSVPIYVSATGGALRCPSSSTVSKNVSSSSTAHLTGADEFVSTSESFTTEPLSLLKVQQFVCSKMIRRLARIKGVLWIKGLDDYRCVLHMSGRGRLGFELDGKWTGPPVSEMAFIGKTSVLDAQLIKSDFGQCCYSSSDESNVRVSNDVGLKVLCESKEFIVLDDMFDSPDLSYFRLSGSEVYGYSEEEIERDLRIDTNAMNKDLADAVNASVDEPKAFLAYAELNNGKTVLCYTGGEPANNAAVLFREATNVLSTHFRNVQVCRCGT